MKAKKYSILRSVFEVEEAMKNELPDNKTVYKFISNGGFSSISFVIYIADKFTINNFYVSTLSVGKKELRMLDVLHDEGKLKNCNFVVGTILKEGNGKNYGYYDALENVCIKNNWKFKATKNHSKILLFETTNGKYVLETSSNLNENPKFEQFSFEKSEDLYNYYLQFFEEMLKD